MAGKDTFVFNLVEATGDDAIKDYDLADAPTLEINA